MSTATKPRLKTSAMIASIAGEGQKTKPAPFGHALAELAPDALESVEALALCNAVRGILPVSLLGARHWSAHPALTDLQARLAMAHPMFSNSAVRA